jgi:hypothetical protein
MTTPKIDIPQVAPGQDTAEYINSLTDDAIMQPYYPFYVTGTELPPADPELTELIRLRNAVAQTCQYCQSIRLNGLTELGADTSAKVLRFEESDEFTDRQKAALRLASAFLEVPSELTAEAKAAALEHFTPEEIVGLMYQLTTFLINKPRAALGIDRPLDADRLTPI